MKISFLRFVLLWTLVVPVLAVAQPEFATEDRTYDRNIRTVLLYPNTNSVTDPLQPPVVPMGQPVPLQLEFDELGTTFRNYYVKIINCNADWTISSLAAINYMDDYNEFFISDRRISQGTRFPYIHYKFILPRVKVSGNYIVKVYRDYNEDDFVLSRRFSVYENVAGIFPTVKFSTDPSARNTRQQVDFNIDYSRLDIVNPMQNLRVVLRQNHRWDNAITDLKPVVLNEQNRYLEYFYFNQENNFNGGNEFRVIEMKSAMYSGFNIMKVKRDSNRAQAFVYPEKSRAGEAYTQPLIPDFDGKYYILNQETGDKEIMPDYMYVTFTLETPSPVEGKVYVMGGMTDWKLDKSFEMTYNFETKKYTCQVLLKQGMYNYRYVLADRTTGKANESYFEGSHSITQNQYDVLVYYRPFGSRADRLIGYRSLNYLGR